MVSCSLSVPRLFGTWRVGCSHACGTDRMMYDLVDRQKRGQLCSCIYEHLLYHRGSVSESWCQAVKEFEANVKSTARVVFCV